MENYVKPMLLTNDGIFEGIYAASGDALGDCWSVSATSVQEWSGSYHVFEIHCVHNDDMHHISAGTTVQLTFSNTLTDAYSEYASTYSGNTVTITRELLADAYQSGDNMTYKVWVKAADEATTRAISCTGAAISCTKVVNVQGNGADGN